MKIREHINLFESQEQEIHEFCKKNKIKEYDITPQGVDVNESVDLYHCKLIELPFQFNIVHGFFECSTGNLKSLRGAPRVVHGNFSCSENKIQSLHDVPKFVKYQFYCQGNLISPWEHRYLLFSEIQGEIRTRNSELNLFFRKYKNQKHLIPQALKELREIQIRCEQKNA